MSEALFTWPMQNQARRRAREIRRAVGEEVRRLREDAGVSQSALARAAAMQPSQLWAIEVGEGQWSIDSLARLAAALGADLSVRLYPNTGPPIRDRHQARMIEALLRVLHPRWRPTLEVAVRSPARGMIDLVVHDPVARIVLAVEAQSELRRVEQQLRWSAEKAASLPSSLVWRTIADTDTRIGRVLLLRSTRTTRALVADLESTFGAAYPAGHAAARRALTTADAAWPGDAIVWVAVDGAGASVLERRPGAPGSARGAEALRRRRPGSASRGLAEAAKDRG